MPERPPTNPDAVHRALVAFARAHKLTAPEDADALARILADLTGDRAPLAAELARPADRPLKHDLERLAPTLAPPDRLAIVRAMVDLTRARAALDYAAVERIKALALLIRVPPPVLNGLLVEMDDPRAKPSPDRPPE